MPSAVRVLMNERSGSCEGQHEPIDAAFREESLPCAISPLCPPPTLAALKLRPGTALAAAGGDGTVNAVGSLLAGTDTCMGVLPLGTLNHFAKDLGLPCDLRAAVRVIAHGVPRPVDVGEVNGSVFLNNSSLGFYPGMVVERERMKKTGRNKWLSLVLASLRGFLRFRRILVRLTLDDGRHIVRHTPFVFVGNNEYILEGPAAGSRTRLDSGRLHLALAPGATRWTMLKLTLAVLFRRVRQVEHFESFCIESLTVEVAGRRVCRVSLDGEVRRIAGPLNYSIRPLALHVLCPAEGDAA